ncbi:hypothetical protein [Colwellia sp. UCD-KL20]|uniref:hypothetical protein n=1 Tax=Colwellia sp. UCD-KL20 TaxID=1917165 RepID=UPI0009F96D3F|nr:hypothetical protein [Colwellia sp. UCD-KL20]
MNIEKSFNFSVRFWLHLVPMVFISVILLSACGSGDEEDTTGNLRFYNLSSNAPAVYLTIDEDLTDEDEDAFEKTYTGVNFKSISASTSISTGNYAYEIAFQNDDSKLRDDLEILLEGNVDIIEASTQLLVLNGNVNAPELLTYDVAIIDDEDDIEDDLFNIQVLNMYESNKGISIYFSKDDETFNEAVFVGQLNYKTLLDNQKFDQDSYIMYLVDVDTNEILFESDTITFAYPSQYILSIRKNTTESSSSYVIDVISNSAVTELIDVNTQSTFKAYNAIKSHDLLPEYEGNLTLHIDNVDYSATVDSFSYGMFSDKLVQENGDYSVSLNTAETNSVIIENHLLTLPENANKTVFFYLQENNVDDDNDGDFDENNDGIVDEVEVSVHSLVLDNKDTQSIFDHEITTLNFIDSDKFLFVKVYFVRNNEMISTTPYAQSISYGLSSSITLLNNTYTVYVVAQDGTSELVLTTFEVVLNEESPPQFMVLENDDSTASGYRVTLAEQ